MITLAIDTSEARGSVALLRGGTCVAVRRHEDGSDYSTWLLPAVEGILTAGGATLEQVELLAVSTGPGSFTGLRVGLTTVKAWAEVYRKPIVGVSRLEAMAQSVDAEEIWTAACYDALRGQLFGGIFKRSFEGLERVGSEVVLSPEEFADLVSSEAREDRVAWSTLDPGMIRDLEGVKRRVRQGDRILVAATELATTIGLLAEKSARAGRFSDPLTLDANYVRRSDAEIFWKGPGASVR